MPKVVKVLIAVILTIALAAAGFFAGYQIKTEVPLDAPIQEKHITLHVAGVSADSCSEYVVSEIVANRLVENLMLRCTPDDLRASISAEVTGSDTLVVRIPMDEEGQMVYFADELTYILNEEIRKDTADAEVTVTDQTLLTIDSTQESSLTTAAICAAVGGVLGILIGAVIVLTGKKKPAGKFDRAK